eukprot:314354-Amphidinium_carterae.1
MAAMILSAAAQSQCSQLSQADTPAPMGVIESPEQEDEDDEEEFEEEEDEDLKKEKAPWLAV